MTPYWLPGSVLAFRAIGGAALAAAAVASTEHSVSTAANAIMTSSAVVRLLEAYRNRISAAAKLLNDSIGNIFGPALLA